MLLLLLMLIMMMKCDNRMVNTVCLVKANIRGSHLSTNSLIITVTKVSTALMVSPSD